MDRYEFDYRKLDGLIHEVFGSRKKFAESMCMSEPTLSFKMTGKRYFTQTEILNAVDLLGIEPGAVSTYFFTPKL